MNWKLFLIALSWAILGVAYQEPNFTPQDALKRLMAGNQRYMNDELEHPNRTQERREASSAKQAPYAIIVGCSDSRVSPEIIFDEGVGDLFVVRVAGNVIGPIEMDSIDFAALYLGSVFILVLGHENCSAVKYVVEGTTQDIETIAKLIRPAVKEAKNDLTEAIKDNALHMKEYLIKSKVIGKLVKEKKIAVEAAYYHLESGSVEFL